MIFRKHKIKRILISRHYDAFGLLTNGGTKWFKPSSKNFHRQLKYHLPHLTKRLLELNPHTVEDFETLLVGRYVYGITKIQNTDGMCYNILT